MRCIEMVIWTILIDAHQSINRNMRCIEMLGWSHTTSSDEVINRNMRCIEIHAGSSGVGGGPGLIET